MMCSINFGSTPTMIVSDVLIDWWRGYDRFLFQSRNQQVHHVFKILQLKLDASTDCCAASSTLFILSFGEDDHATVFSYDDGSAGTYSQWQDRRKIGR